MAFVMKSVPMSHASVPMQLPDKGRPSSSFQFPGKAIQCTNAAILDIGV